MPRTDKKKNVGKVAEELVKNPHATIRELADETWLSVWAAHSSKKEVEQSWTKDWTIAYIVGKSKDVLKWISDINAAFVDNVKKKLDDGEKITREEFKDVNSIANDELKRITVLWGDLTDDDWWFKAADEKQIKAVQSLLDMIKSRDD